MRYSQSNRRGAATVEVAITAPILLLIVFGGIECSRANMMRNAAEVAAIEGARVGIVPGATAQKCKDRALEELAILKVVDGDVQVSPAVITNTTTEVTVVVTIPLSKNSLPLSQFVVGKTLIQSIKLTREID